MSDPYDLSYTVYDEERGLYILNLGEEHLLVNEEGLFVVDRIKRGLSSQAIQEQFETRFEKPISEQEIQESKALLSNLETPEGESYLEFALVSDLHTYTKYLSFLSPWLINMKAGAALLFLFGIALYQMASHGDAFRLTASAIIELPVTGWILSMGYMTATVILHELMHVLACEKYGVTPGACGFRFKLIFPFLYIDIPSSWQCSQKARIVISAAGSAANVVLLSAAIFLVVYYPLGEHVHTALVLTVYTNIITLFAVINPFMKEDGYNIVSDALKIPNLMPRAIEYLKSKFKGGDFEYLSPHEKTVFPLYAVGLVGFRIFFYALTVFILYRVARWVFETLAL